MYFTSALGKCQPNFRTVVCACYIQDTTDRPINISDSAAVFGSQESAFEWSTKELEHTSPTKHMTVFVLCSSGWGLVHVGFMLWSAE